MESNQTVLGELEEAGLFAGNHETWVNDGIAPFTISQPDSGRP